MITAKFCEDLYTNIIEEIERVKEWGQSKRGSLLPIVVTNMGA